MKDIANIKRGYATPPTEHLRLNGKPALALGISTVSGGNVVTMGEGLKKRLVELEPQIPAGIEMNYIYMQSDMVIEAIDNFVISLLQAIAIVILVLMIFMGMRSGLLIGVVLLLTVMSTFIFMYIYHIDLQRISLGALVIALGMLVDNAIVVTEGILIRIEQGMDRLKAAKEVVAQTMWPLFAATVIAILAFAAIGISQDTTGEYLRSLFQVMLISLSMSWLIAITITPLFCVMFLKDKDNKGENQDPYGGLVFRVYKAFLRRCIQFRLLTISAVFGLMVFAVYAFGLLEDSFFPYATNPQFYVHYWLPEGTDIRVTSRDAKKIEDSLLQFEEVEQVASFVGNGAPRFLLVYTPEKNYDSYAFIMVTLKDYRLIDTVIPKIRQAIQDEFLDSNPKIEKIRLGPGGGYAIEARFSGPDPKVLRDLSKQAKTILRNDGGATGVRDDFRERVKLIRPLYSDEQAKRAGINRDDLSQALKTAFLGTRVGVYREGDELIPIVSRAPDDERNNVNNINDVQVWSWSAQAAIPIRQVVTDFETTWEDSLRMRRNKKLTITTQADQASGNASTVFERVREPIESIELPIGYEMEWGGEYEDARDAQLALSKNLPVTFVLMVLILVILFNSVRHPIIIWLTVPLALIGVSLGLFVTGLPFDFMALLGFLSLSGMLIKNAIVLLDEINIQLAEGKEQFYAILDASVSRMRPVSMAAVTTILGMIPLLQDVFFVAMAVTIMAGLAFATVLTLILVPVYYTIFFRVSYIKESKR